MKTPYKSIKRKFAFSFILVLCLLNQFGFSQETLTVGEVFDFEIGDIFQYRSSLSGEPSNADQYTIQDKWYSSGNDTVFYSILKEHYDLYNEDEPRFSSQQITQYYTGLDSVVVNHLYTYYCEGSTRNELIDMTSVYVPDIFINDCNIATIGYGINAWNNYDFICGKGMGIIRREYWAEEDASVGGPTTLYSMIYFKKGENECGTRDLMNSREWFSAENEISLFPVPAFDILKIRLSDRIEKPCNIDFIDCNGRVIKRLIALQKENQTDVSGLPEGLYFVHVYSGDERISGKVLIN